MFDAEESLAMVIAFLVVIQVEHFHFFDLSLFRDK
jgi:hypothetical protein